MKKIKFLNLKKLNTVKVINYITSNLVIIRIKNKNYVREVI